MPSPDPHPAVDGEAILALFKVKPRAEMETETKQHTEANLEQPAQHVQGQEQYLQYVQGLQLVRSCASGKFVEARMEAGPAGFAVGFFPDEPNEPVRTEVPNISLAVAQGIFKRPASSRMNVAHKKPATKRPVKDRGLAIESDGDSQQPEEARKLVDHREGGGVEAAFQKKNFAFTSKTWGDMRAEYYTGKSYLRYRDEEKKWRLVIGTQGAGHQDLLEKLIAPAMKGHMTKEKLVEIRDALK